jgi:hypothetical protein
MGFRKHALHAEPTINAALLMRINYEKGWLAKERQFVVQKFMQGAVSGIESKVIPILVWAVSFGEPLGKGH